MNTRLIFTGLVLSILFFAGRAPAAETIKGQVLGGGAPIAQSENRRLVALLDKNRHGCEPLPDLT